MRPAELPSWRLEVIDGRLHDALGREVVLRGVNTGGRSKLAPFVPFAFRESGLAGQADAPPFDEAAAAYFDRVRDWGHAVVRLPFSWEGIEPERGVYDQVYLDRYAAMIEAAAARGLRVIVDFHQDVWASPFCGDGFPLWTLPEPLPEPPVDCENWYLAYFNDPALAAAYDRFWAGQDGLRAAFVEMWREVAGRTWPLEGVVAFEVINEPSPGNADEADWAPSVLRDFYTELAAEIRAVAPGALIVFDAGVMTSATAQTSLDRPVGAGLIFGPHYYDPLVMMTDRWTGGTDLGLPLGRLRAYADGWQVPALLGEFGARRSCLDGTGYLRAFYEALDAERLHATVWEYSWDELDWNHERYSLVGADGQESPLAAEVVRAYPAAVAGRIVGFGYDAAERTGSLVYEARAGGLTEVVVPARLYPGGLSASVSDPTARWAHHPASQRLLVETGGAGRVTLRFGPGG